MNPPYSLLHRISSSGLSRCEKWALTTIVVHADGTKCKISFAELSSLTSTSIRHLSRVINKLSSDNLLKILRRSGRCNIYILPAVIQVVKGELRPCWDKKPASSSSQSARNYPKNKKFTSDPLLAKAWASAFSTQYHAISAAEQNAMDYMLYAYKNNQLCGVKSPIGYLKTIVKNGHPDDFTHFSPEKSESLPVVDNQKNDDEQQTRLDLTWNRYLALPRGEKNRLKKKFETDVIQKGTVSRVSEIFQDKGFSHPAIRGLYSAFLAQTIP